MKLTNYRQEESRINKTIEVFNEKNAERIFRHERLLPYLDDLRNYFNILDSTKSMALEIKQEEPGLANKIKAVTETLNAIAKLTGSTIEKQNAVDALTKFRDRVIYLTTNKINSEKALNEQKVKIAGYLKRATLLSYKNYESGKIDVLKSKLQKEFGSITSKIEDLVNQTKIKKENIIEQKEIVSERLKGMGDLKMQVERFTENRNKLKEKEEQILEVAALINNNKPELEKLTELKKLKSLQINDVREKREKKLREKNLEEDRELLKPGEPCPLCGSIHHPYIHEYVNNVSELTKELEGLENEERKYELGIQSFQKEINIHSGTLEALQKEKGGHEREMADQKNKIEIRKKQLRIEKVGSAQVIEADLAALEKSLKAINELEKLVATTADLEDFKEAVDELALRSIEFEKAKSEVEQRYKGTSIRKDCDELSQQFNNYNDAIQKTETNIHSLKKRIEELNKQQARIESSLGSVLLSFGYPEILSSHADVLPDSEFRDLKQQSSDLEGSIKSTKALIRGAIERKQQLPLNEDIIKSKEELAEELNVIRQQLEQDKQNLAGYQAQKKGR